MKEPPVPDFQNDRTFRFRFLRTFKELAVFMKEPAMNWWFMVGFFHPVL